MACHAHQAAAITKQLVDYDVVRDDPAHPVEEREGLEDVSGEEVPARRGEESVEEEPLAADTSAITHASVVLGVQSVEQRTCHKVCRPNWQLGYVSPDAP